MEEDFDFAWSSKLTRAVTWCPNSDVKQIIRWAK